MRGHIKKRYAGTYTIVVSLGTDPVTGKPKQLWTSVKGKKPDAEKKLAELLNQLDSGSFIKPGKLTLAEFLNRWMRDHVKPNLAPRTAEGYESIIRCHLIPALGSMAIVKLAPQHIAKYYADKLNHGRFNGQGMLNPMTVRHHSMCLHAALETAVRWGILQRNPADAVDPPTARRPELHTMNEEDLHKLLEAARNTPYYALFYTALFTGMRRSEILALRWSDIDLLLCTISVNRAMHKLRTKEIVFRQPKSALGRRLIALSPSAVQVLREYKEQQETQHLLVGKQLPDDALIFSQLDGSPLLPDTISNAWRKLAKRTGLKGIRFHDARHTHASLMLKQGIHPKVVQERLGHATISTTLDIYSHVAPGLQQAAALRFDEGLTRRENISQVIKEK